MKGAGPPSERLLSKRQLPVKACLCQTLPFLSSSAPLLLIPIIQHDPEKSYKISFFQDLCGCGFFLWKTGGFWSEYSAKMDCHVESQIKALGCSISNPCMS